MAAETGETRTVEYGVNELKINVGPQHPSTHGVFRVTLTLDSETILDAEPAMGYLHRGIEKLNEQRTYEQCIPLTDRLDYVAAFLMNFGYCVAVERLAGIEVPERAEYLRVIMGELTRICSHLVAVGTFAADIGTWFTPFMYCFREREKVLDLFEMTFGARLTHSYGRVGGVSEDIKPEFIPGCKKWMDEFPRLLDELEELLTNNEVLLMRTKGVGVLPPEAAINYSISGPNLRASSVYYDIRKTIPYSLYDRFEFDIPLGKNGDVFDRYWVRIQEMRQSLRIVEQALKQLPKGPVMATMHGVLRLPPGEYYSAIESARGELGYYIVSDGSAHPWRFKVRSPSFINLGVLKELLIGWKVADLIAILGSIDIVLGEVDR